MRSLSIGCGCRTFCNSLLSFVGATVPGHGSVLSLSRVCFYHCAYSNFCYFLLTLPVWLHRGLKPLRANSAEQRQDKLGSGCTDHSKLWTPSSGAKWLWIYYFLSA